MRNLNSLWTARVREWVALRSRVLVCLAALHMLINICLDL